MLLGYNTNGFAHHRLEDAILILHDLGYQSIALTLDYHSLNPYDPDLAAHLSRIQTLLTRNQMRCVIETGARFLLDPWKKHQPTLLSRGTYSEQRLAFLKHSVDIAKQLNADAVSFWSGTSMEDVDEDTLWQRLLYGCRELSEYAEKHGVRLAFEPEPGMFIDTMERFGQLYEQINHPSFGLTLDVGHLHCQGEFPLESHILQWRDILWNVHMEDMRQGVHDHLMFGEGEMNFEPIFKALTEIDYQGGVHVELSRHSHQAVETSRKAMSFLRPFLDTNSK